MNQLYRVVLLGICYWVCSVNLWRLLGNNKQPEEQEVNENNKEETKQRNTGNRAKCGHGLVRYIDSGIFG